MVELYELCNSDSLVKVYKNFRNEQSLAIQLVKQVKLLHTYMLLHNYLISK
jgi:hypothetical protein